MQAKCNTPPPPPLELLGVRGAQVVGRGEGGPQREVASAPTEGQGGGELLLGLLGMRAPPGRSAARDARVPTAAAPAPVAASVVRAPISGVRTPGGVWLEA